jgi:hypothetical protein
VSRIASLRVVCVHHSVIIYLATRRIRLRLHVNLRGLPGGDGAITGAIACPSDVTDAAELREELARLVTYDSLTGCLSRRAVLEQIATLTATGVPVTVLSSTSTGSRRSTTGMDIQPATPCCDMSGHASWQA